MQRCRIITTGTRYTSVELAVNRSGVYYISGYRYCLVCLSRLWCTATMFTKYCGSRTLERLSSLCAKLILNRDQLVKYLGFPLPELEIIYPICAKGCRKIRDAEFLEDIRYSKSVVLYSCGFVKDDSWKSSVIYFMRICNTGVLLISNGKISCDLIRVCSDDSHEYA